VSRRIEYIARKKKERKENKKNNAQYPACPDAMFVSAKQKNFSPPTYSFLALRLHYAIAIALCDCIMQLCDCIMRLQYPQSQSPPPHKFVFFSRALVPNLSLPAPY